MKKLFGAMVLWTCLLWAASASAITVSVEPPSVSADTSSFTISVQATGCAYVAVFQDMNGDLTPDAWELASALVCDGSTEDPGQFLTPDMDPAPDSITTMFSLGGGMLAPGQYIVQAHDSAMNFAYDTVTVTASPTGNWISGSTILYNSDESAQLGMLPNAAVVLSDKASGDVYAIGFSGADGNYSMDVPAAASTKMCTLSVRKGGYISGQFSKMDFMFGIGGHTGYVVGQIMNDASISGTVASADTPFGTVPGASITGKDAAGRASAEPSGPNGSYYLPALAGGLWKVECEPPAGFMDAKVAGAWTRFANVSTGALNTVDFALIPINAWLDAVVCDEGGMRVQDALVFANASGTEFGEIGNGAYTNYSGNTKVGLRQGQWQAGVCINCHNRPAMTGGVPRDLVPPPLQSFSLYQGQTQPLSFMAYNADATIEGNVCGSGPWDDVRVEATCDNPLNGVSQTPIGAGITTQSDVMEDGSYRIPVLGGQWKLRAFNLDGTKRSRTFTTDVFADGDEIIEDNYPYERYYQYPCLYQAETEPNDSAAQANPIDTSGAQPYGAIGDLDTAGDPYDWYSFQAGAGDDINVTIQTDGGAGQYMETALLNGQLNVLDSDTDPDPMQSLNAKAPATGTYYVRVRNTSGGLWEYTVDINIMADYMPPMAEITQPAYGATLTGNSFEIKGTADDMGGVVESVDVVIDGATFPATDISGDGSWSQWSYMWAPMPLGTHSIAAVGHDAAGNSSYPNSRMVTVDNLPDGDGDGIPDVNDNCAGTVNPDQKDWDYDGQGDACDIDDDGDGFVDAFDNCPMQWQPDQTDYDGDGLGDSCDNCYAEPNPDQADFDNDWAGDACDDSDGDTVMDNADNCPDVYNWDQMDNDLDGVGNVCDNCPYNANPGQADTDGDGVGDYCDDSDGDGAMDVNDNCPDVYNWDQMDWDSDGLGNDCDNCVDAYNPGQSDLDGDGGGDACDLGDYDGDGFADAYDNCPAAYNPGQEDIDANGLGDACDHCSNGIMDADETDMDCGGLDCQPCVQDMDGDGVPDATDNCPNDYNPGQEDMDYDGMGDVCDPWPGCAANDPDGDNVCNETDNCPATPNTDQADLDADGIGDACDACTDTDGDGACEPGDNCPGLLNADQADTDADGIGDACDACTDGDLDGVCEPGDNCPALANADQADMDLDGAGDACDDSDGDGVLDDSDNCPLDTNPGQEDSDRDRLGDACDLVADPPVMNFSGFDGGNPFGGFIGSVGGGPQEPWFGSYAYLFIDGYNQAPRVDPAQYAGLWQPGLHAATGTNITGWNSLDINDPGKYAFDFQGYAFQSTVADNDPESPTYMQEFRVYDGTGGTWDLWDTDLGVKVGTGSLTTADAVLDYQANSSTMTGIVTVANDGGAFYNEVLQKYGTNTLSVTMFCPEGPIQSKNPGAPLIQQWSVYGMEVTISAPDADGDGIPDGLDACPNDPANDIDVDGVCGDMDNCPDVANAGQGDIDADGIGDVCDDSDADGLLDAADNCPTVANAAQTDFDGDGIGDACDTDNDGDGVADNPGPDNCPAVANADQADMDADGIGDLCDDSDGDGIADAADNCPVVANPDQANLDGDGMGDACDDDRDNDGVADAADNCPDVSNAGQHDFDDDGVGNFCDACVYDAMDDADGDGRCADVDNCPFMPNPGQEDADGDGIGDPCDNNDCDEAFAVAATPYSHMQDNYRFDNLGEPAGCLAKYTEWFSFTAPANGRLVTDTGGSNFDTMLTAYTGPCGSLVYIDCDDDGLGGGLSRLVVNAQAGTTYYVQAGSYPNNQEHGNLNVNINFIPDNDMDGIADADDPDDDNDGVADGADNCPMLLGGNADQTDTDGDGQGDICDGDDDNDTLPDGADNCPLIPNTQMDTDGDGIGDACDACTDVDADGVCSPGPDNCPAVSNPTQADMDADGVGDACDDSDGDGWTDENDNCPNNPNLSQTDTDLDGIGDACDDQTPPASVINTPLEGVAITTGSYTVTGTASDTGSGVALVEVSIDGGPWTAAQDLGGGTWANWRYVASLPAPANHTIAARATDNSGNVEAAGPSRTIVTSLADVMALAPDTAWDVTVGAPVTWTATAVSASASGVEYEFWKYGPSTGNTWQVARAYSPVNTWTWTSDAGDAGSTRFKVQVRTIGGTAASHDVMLSEKTINVFASSPPAMASTLVCDKNFKEAVGTPIKWTAAATGGSGTYEYEFWLYGPASGNTWVMKRAYSAVDNWTWTPAAGDVGADRVRVYVRNQGQTNAYDSVKLSASPTTVVAKMTDVTITSNKSGNEQSGTSITWTAAGAGGTGPYEYQFWQYGPATGNTWVMKRAYSATATWTWVTTDADLGTNRVMVYARNTGTSSTYEAAKLSATTITITAALPDAALTSLTSDKSYTESAGTTFNWTATASGGTGSYEYEFWLYGPSTGNVWTKKRNYSTAATWAWVSSAADVGTNRVKVHVRNAGATNSYDAILLSESTITILSATPPAGISSLTSDQPNSVDDGTPVTWTATGTGGTGSYEYEFWLYGPASGNTWVKTRAYSSTNTWTWMPVPADLGVNRVMVKVRNAGSTKAYDAVKLSNTSITVY